MDLGLEGKVAVVLAATAGIGKAIARSLLAEGARVAISGRDIARLEAALAELRPGHGERVLGQPLDVTDAAAVSAHFAQVRQALGPIDVLVWNSGGPPPGSASEVTCDKLEAAYRLLLEAAVHATREVLPAMRARRWGRIIAVTSLAVRQPIPQLALSNIMRSGLTAYLKSLSLEVARDGVLVNSVCTGLFDTERLSDLLQRRAAAAGRSPDEERRLTEASVPAGRIGRPSEFGDLVAFLASERASYLNGVAIPLDGGLNQALL